MVGEGVIVGELEDVGEINIVWKRRIFWGWENWRHNISCVEEVGIVGSGWWVGGIVFLRD